VKVASSTPGGALSDRWGRRNTIISGWLLYAAVYLGFALAAVRWQIWALFAVYGLFSGLTEGAERALVIDLVPDDWRGRALGTYQAAVGIAMLPASLVFGAVYQHAGARPAFILGAILALGATAILPRSPARPCTDVSPMKCQGVRRADGVPGKATSATPRRVSRRMCSALGPK